jgi:osmoprotectant transport system substrate-binding protein
VLRAARALHRIPELFALEDDKHLQLSNNIVAVVRTAVDKPPLTTVLDKVDTTLTQTDLVALNQDPSVTHQDPATRAQAYVTDHGLSTLGTGGSGQDVQTRDTYVPALEAGHLDVMPEYAASLTEFLNQKDNGATAKALASSDISTTMAALTTIAAKHGLVPLTPSAATDEDAFAVRRDFAKAHHLTTLSDLASYTGTLVLGGPATGPTDPTCEPGLETTYGVHFTGFQPIDDSGPDAIFAIQSGAVQIGIVLSSDPSLSTST